MPVAEGDNLAVVVSGNRDASAGLDYVQFNLVRTNKTPAHIGPLPPQEAATVR